MADVRQTPVLSMEATFTWEGTPSAEQTLDLENIVAAVGDVHAFICDTMAPYLAWTGPFTLRLLNFFLCTYARDVSYVHYVAQLDREVRVQPYFLHRSEKQALGFRRYSLFTTFLSGSACLRFVRDGTTYRTTVAQLRFFSVAHAYGILKYVHQHIAAISAAMRPWFAASLVRMAARRAARAAARAEAADVPAAADVYGDEFLADSEDDDDDASETAAARVMADCAPCADDCAICLEACDAAVVVLTCLHKFHRACIDMWTGPCPLCRCT